ncbi:hypothetical protein FNV43_RR15036 [Rhamnella rubrinervis]|uniref:HSF-type DNA-binding domain-containing protein n=1 Tax=Rhamnella rubrinervis TaxID=2594499 RepID=A0A8K0E144_9ROSA|nr:hypothetical protein FNV43_RR15036 [Rhamnella rubrinervis]
MICVRSLIELAIADKGKRKRLGEGLAATPSLSLSLTRTHTHRRKLATEFLAKMEVGARDTAAITNAPNTLPPFLSKTYDMVDDPSTDSIVSWGRRNNSFVVRNVHLFSRDLLPKYFKHNHFSSFVRQLNTYGFKKVDPDQWEFANEGFLRGQKDLLKTISRRKPAHIHSHQQQPQFQSPKVGVCVEVGKFGLDEEVEILKRDKNVLMQELVRLRQQQQTTDHQLHNVGQRVQVMEQRQQKMMSFLAKAMHSPGFLSHLVQQQNESNRRITVGNKKRRLPSQGKNTAAEHDINAPDGRIVKYEPSMNEAAKAMFRQILKMNSSPRLQPVVNSPDAFLINNAPSSRSDSGRTYRQISEVAITEAPPAQSFMLEDSGFPVTCPSGAISEIQSSPDVVTNCVEAAQFSEAKVQSPQEDKVLPDFSQMQGITTQSTVEFPDVNFLSHETTNSEYVDLSAVLDGTMPTETDAFSSDLEGGMSDGVPKLPGINDAFWEQFFTAGHGDNSEINSCSVDGEMTKDQELLLGKENAWDKTQHLSHLTELMGLLASESRSG